MKIVDSFKEDDSDPVYRDVKSILKAEHGLSIEDVAIHHGFTENGCALVQRKKVD